MGWVACCCDLGVCVCLRGNYLQVKQGRYPHFCLSLRSSFDPPQSSWSSRRRAMLSRKHATITIQAVNRPPPPQPTLPKHQSLRLLPQLLILLVSRNTNALLSWPLAHRTHRDTPELSRVRRSNASTQHPRIITHARTHMHTPNTNAERMRSKRDVYTRDGYNITRTVAPKARGGTAFWKRTRTTPLLP